MLFRHLAVPLLLGIAAPALAEQCDLKAKVSESAATYEPFAPSNTLLDLNVVVTNRGSAACSASFFVGPLNGSLSVTSGTSRILYRIDGQRNSTAQLATGFGPFLANVPARSTQSLPIRFVLPAQQIVPRGEYTSDIAVVGIGHANERLEITGGTSTLRVRVPGRVEMNISGTASPGLSQAGMAAASMDFGVAQTGQTERVFVNVWSNSSVSVSLESFNKGQLKLVGHEDLSPIRYSARFDGAPVSLAGAYTVGRTPPPSLAGASYELAVTLGDLRGKFAGRYKDVIAVTVNEN